jgi:hypothetical protein
MSSTTVTRGNSHETFYIQPTFDNTSNSLAANTTTAVTYNVPGLLTTDQICVFGYNGSQTAGVVIAEADCLTAGVLTIQYGNLTSTATLKPASGVYTIQIVRLEGNPAPVNAA